VRGQALGDLARGLDQRARRRGPGDVDQPVLGQGDRLGNCPVALEGVKDRGHDEEPAVVEHALEQRRGHHRVLPGDELGKHLARFEHLFAFHVHKVARTSDIQLCHALEHHCPGPPAAAVRRHRLTTDPFHRPGEGHAPRATPNPDPRSRFSQPRSRLGPIPHHHPTSRSVPRRTGGPDRNDDRNTAHERGGDHPGAA
jgi:hypothetical protein